jgi:hypothetical protein
MRAAHEGLSRQAVSRSADYRTRMVRKNNALFSQRGLLRVEVYRLCTPLLIVGPEW